ncbi:MAG: hypothetical protein LBI69_00905 [Puniceicoccales bacterium]|nr:hypothetical protein [Puniceicoccales bacterium]
MRRLPNKWSAVAESVNSETEGIAIGYSMNSLATKIRVTLAYLFAATVPFGMHVSRAVAAENQPSIAGKILPVSGHVCQLQLSPPKSLAEKVMGALKSNYPQCSAGTLPMVLLGFWGYPDFDGLSSADPVSVFFFPESEIAAGGKDGQRFPWVICAKIDDGSPIHNSLALLRFKIKKFSGWTFFFRENNALPMEDGATLEKLVNMAEISSKNDIVLRVFRDGIESFVSNYEKRILRNLYRLGQLDGCMPGISLINLMVNFMRQVESLQCALDVSGDVLAWNLLLSAKNGSDLACIFNAPIDSIDVGSIAQNLPSSDIAQVIFRYDPEIIKTLMKHIADALYVYGESQSLADFKEKDVYAFIDALSAGNGGAATLCIGRDDNGAAAVTSLWQVDATTSQLANWVNFAYANIAPVIFHTFAGSLDGERITLHGNVIQKAFNYSGRTVTRAEISRRSEKIHGQMPANGAVKNRYYCAFDQLIGVANSDSAMRNLIDGVRRKKQSEPFASGELPFEENMSLRGHCNLISLMELIGNVPVSKSTDAPSAIANIIEFSVRQGNDRISAEVRVPYAALENLFGTAVDEAEE